MFHLSVSGTALYQCQNGGGNIAPGQNRVLVGPATSDTAIPASAIKNGESDVHYESRHVNGRTNSVGSGCRLSQQ